MNHKEDPFNVNDRESSLKSTQLKQQLTEQDLHLNHLHQTLQQVRHQTDTLHSELLEHNNLLDRLGSRMDDTEGSFDVATRRVKLLYKELTDKKFNFTATVLIFVLTILLVILLFL